MIALATVILLVPAAHAQPVFNPEKYVSFPDEHVGLNKYLKSDFIFNGLSSQAVPFCISFAILLSSKTASS